MLEPFLFLTNHETAREGSLAVASPPSPCLWNNLWTDQISRAQQTTSKNFKGGKLENLVKLNTRFWWTIEVFPWHCQKKTKLSRHMLRGMFWERLDWHPSKLTSLWQNGFKSKSSSYLCSPLIIECKYIFSSTGFTLTNKKDSMPLLASLRH